MMTFIILIIMLLPSGREEVVRDESDFVEINHCYRYNHADKVFEKKFIQIIWWEFRSGLFVNDKGEDLDRPISDFVVKDFRVIWSNSSIPKKITTIVPRYHRGNWVCIFYDKDHRALRETLSKWKKITHTTHDPEMSNRKMLAMEYRTKLTAANVKVGGN